MSPDISVIETSSVRDAPLKGFLLWLEQHPTYSSLHGPLRNHIKQGCGPFATSRSGTQLIRFSAPLAVFLAAVEYRDIVLATQDRPPFTDIYIAQSSLELLPEDLQEDVQTPELVKHVGKGDVYGSSIWLGLEPTYTPLHKDPNPNVFCQLSGSKVIRIIPPGKGAQVFREAQQKAGSNSFSPLLSAEMMTGVQRDILHQAVWEQGTSADILEATLGPGDAMFIPKGWWHSVKSLGGQGRVNGSVNWWFR
ncbi:Clavaminate synthase-like protein [Thozetella sp. PMI_491]|nr:Clavaminate synthase-like protein [Thozetella sp. PMI_491]